MGPLGHSLALLFALGAAPLGLAALAVRPAWRVGLRERLGRIERPEPGGVWVHGASVGEALAASRLIEHLRTNDHGVFASATSPNGRELMRRIQPEIGCALAPLDHPWCVEAALRRVRPELLVMVETELWPSWIAAARRTDVPVVVVSGRLSDRSFPRYRRVRGLLGQTLRSLAAVGARSELDAERFVALGVPEARVEVTGDLKLEPTGGGNRALAIDLVRALSAVPIFVAGSTHPGEEGAALQAIAAAERQGLAVALVVAPRHPERAHAVEKEAREAGREVRRRSTLEGPPLASGEVLLLDTIGELPAIYAAAAVAFVGGTLVPIGGHNVLEPVFAGCPVLFGPHTENVRGAVEIVERSGAGTRLTGPDDLARAVVEALQQPEARRERGARGQAALEVHRGSAVRTSILIERVLDESSSRRRR